MSSSDDNVTTFVSILKKVRLRTDESSQIKERILAFTHGNFVLDDCMPAFRQAAASASVPALEEEKGLFAYEKSLLFSNVESFVQDHPQRAKVQAAGEHGKPLRITMWHGANLFRHVQPFFVQAAR